MELAQRITDTYQSSTPPVVAPLASPAVTCLERLQLVGQAARDRTLRRESLAVLIELAQRVNADLGVAWPSQEWVAQELGMVQPSISRALKQLEALGYLTRSWEPPRPGLKACTVYRLYAPEPEAPDITPVLSEAGEHSSAAMCDITPVLSEGIAPVPYKQSSKNPVREPGTRKIPSGSSGAAVPKAPKVPKPPEPKLGYLPDDWQPDEQAITQAMARCQLSREQVLDQLERFKVNHQSKLTRAANWYALWGIWLKNVGPGGPYRWMVDPAGKDGTRPTNRGHIGRIEDVAAWGWRETP